MAQASNSGDWLHHETFLNLLFPKESLWLYIMYIDEQWIKKNNQTFQRLLNTDWASTIPHEP